MVDEFSVKNVNLLCASELNRGDRFFVRVRYRARLADCLVDFAVEDEVRIRFAEPQPPVASGQSAVFYDDKGVIAFGGVII